ncbi:MAG: T9SS C-terminal target domain-containing protein [Marinilabiliales bacterium]|nr:MAG: T9SS C-terminal target domain-containing protein [Marinilabiliales bacterium]
MLKEKTIILLFLLNLTFMPVGGQTGPSYPGQDTLLIFSGSGENQILLHHLDSSTFEIAVTSEDPEILSVTDVIYVTGQTFAIVMVEEQGEPGQVSLEISIDGSIRYLEVHIVNYPARGVNYEIHDIVFWQTAVPLGEVPIFDTILEYARNPHFDLNWEEIPITVNMDCTSPVCWGYDFYTGFYTGYFIAPETGAYNFYMQSADNTALWLSDGTDMNNAAVIIDRGEGIGTSAGQNRIRSEPVELVKGNIYAFYATQWIIHNPAGGLLVEGPHNDQPEYLGGDLVMPLYDVEKPTSPENLELVWRATEKAFLSWDASTDNYRVDGYNLYLNGLAINDDLIRGTSFVADSLIENTVYYALVTAVDDAGNESFVSNTLKFRTHPEDTIPPSPPAEIELLQATGLAMELQWTGGEDGETEVIAYNLYVDNNLYNTAGYIYDTSIIIKGLRPVTSYEITVESVDAGFNVSQPGDVSVFSTTEYDPLEPDNLGINSGRVVIHDQNISRNEGFGINGPYENREMVDKAEIRELLRELQPGAIRWGAITANSKSFAAHTGTGHNNNTYGRVMNFANELGARFALTVGVQDGIDYRKEPETFLRLMEYLGGPADTPGGERRAAEGFTGPLLDNSKGVLIEFGNEVWGASAHDAEIGSDYKVYREWAREMAGVIRSSPYYDPEKITMVYSGRNPEPWYGVNRSVLTGDRGEVECLGVSGYLGGNLDYDPAIPRGDSELDYYNSGIALARSKLSGMQQTMDNMMHLTGTLKSFYLYESNMTRTNYNGRFGQAILMTDYLAAGMEYGSIVPSLFHLTGGQWRITRPAENYRQLPLFITGKYFNRFCKGHNMKTEFLTANSLTHRDGRSINWEPVGTYAYNRGENFSILLINRDFTEDYTIQVSLPGEIAFSSDAMMYTIWEDDFSSFDYNIDSISIALTDGMFVEIPRHAMIIIAATGDDPGYEELPLGYYNRIRPDSIYVRTDGDGHISADRQRLNIYATVFPENARFRKANFEVLENTTGSSRTDFATNRVMFTGSGNAEDEGHIVLRVYAADNPDVSDTLVINVSNQAPVNIEEAKPGSNNQFFYPNPAGDILYLQESVESGSLVGIFDTAGRPVMQLRLADTHLLQIGQLKPGNYIIRIESPDGKVYSGIFTRK